MPHDFAKQREVRASRSGKKPVAPWLWFSSGVVIGAFCSFLLYLAVGAPLAARPRQPPPQACAEQAPAVDAESVTQTPPQPAGKGGPVEKPQFDFYTLLPESEVIVGGRQAADNPDRNDGKDKPATTTTPANPSVLLLQAGSFRKREQADHRRGEIILLGYEAGVDTVAVAKEGTWYRVHVGPFPTADALATARKALLEQGFDTLEISKRPQ